MTGGTGFIGRATTICLESRGHEVHVATRRADALSPARVHSADLSDGKAVETLLADIAPEAIVHLAWFTTPGSYLTAETENLQALAASANLLAAAARFGCARVLLGGSCLEAPRSATDTVYARSKRALHAAAVGSSAIDVTCAHIFSVYGPGEHPRRAVPSVIRALLRGESISLTAARQHRDYLHVEDVASALAALVEAERVATADVCSGVARPLHEIFSLIGGLLERPNLVRIGMIAGEAVDEFDVIGDPADLFALDWQPSYSIDVGLRRTIDYWRTQLRNELEPISR